MNITIKRHIDLLSRCRTCIHHAREITNNTATKTFECRTRFQLPKKFDHRVWFPLHMSVQLAKMTAKLRSMDLIIEVVPLLVHDSRIPITGRNPQFYSKLYAVRPHILVMNKMDLIKPEEKQVKMIEEYYANNNVQNFIWTNCKRRTRKPIEDLQRLIIKSIVDEPRFNRTVKTEYQVMVVGIPNVGKSSLINCLRATGLGNTKKACEEGARPGVTIRVQNRVRINDLPPIYIVDTPGVINPYARDIDSAMKLALCDLVLQSSIELNYVADYLLYWMNKNNDHSYVKHFRLRGGPSDDIRKVLLDICESNDFRLKCLIANEYVERWDLDFAAIQLIKLFRQNKLRSHCLDAEYL